MAETSDELKPLIDWFYEKYEKDERSKSYVGRILHIWQSAEKVFFGCCNICESKENIRCRTYEWIEHSCWGGPGRAKHGTVTLCLQCYCNGWIFPSRFGSFCNLVEFEPNHLTNIKTLETKSIKLHHVTL